MWLENIPGKSNPTARTFDSILHLTYSRTEARTHLLVLCLADFTRNAFAPLLTRYLSYTTHLRVRPNFRFVGHHYPSTVQRRGGGEDQLSAPYRHEFLTRQESGFGQALTQMKRRREQIPQCHFFSLSLYFPTSPGDWKHHEDMTLIIPICKNEQDATFTSSKISGSRYALAPPLLKVSAKKIAKAIKVALFCLELLKESWLKSVSSQSRQQEPIVVDDQTTVWAHESWALANDSYSTSWN